MGATERVTFVTEPLLSTEFVQYRIIAPLLSRLKQGFDVTLAAPALSPDVQDGLANEGIRAVSLHAWFPPPRHPRDEVPSYVLSWLRDSLLGLNRRGLDALLGHDAGLRVNFTMTSACHADIWYVMGRPIGPTLQTIQKSLAWRLRLPVSVFGPMAGVVDRHHTSELAGNAGWTVASNQFLAEHLEAEGHPVEGVLNILLSPNRFGPTTRSPTRDYILVYLGKETDTEAVGELIRTGLPIKLFGAKSAGWVASAINGSGNPNVERVGFLSEPELKDLYTNALFTAFPFTEEPFGLVPVESMACGTPVLTYGRQGPAETVVDELTGWLVPGRSEFVAKAQQIVRDGYDPSFIGRCLTRVRRYHVDTIANGWRELLADRLANPDSAQPHQLRRFPGNLAEPSFQLDLEPASVVPQWPVLESPALDAYPAVQNWGNVTISASGAKISLPRRRPATSGRQPSPMADAAIPGSGPLPPRGDLLPRPLPVPTKAQEEGEPSVRD